MQPSDIMIAVNQVILRDQQPSNVDAFVKMQRGTEALRLWVDYLVLHSSIHRISLDTWSFNPRMIRVAQKLGFAYEGAQREMQCWQGQWLDLIHYGLLRSEWEALHQGDGGKNG